MGESRAKDILNRVISELGARKNGYCRISHKRGWLEYLLDGDPMFSPEQLHGGLRTVIDSDTGKPRGEKLFHLHRKSCFTIMPDKTPYRPEEALERFIVLSNGENFFNQIPIGGGKESVDIGIQDSKSKFTFVELKPWRSHNSPLYAIVESLKNLTEYRVILERSLASVPRFQEVNLMVLAPSEYYQNYGLVGNGNVGTLHRTLADLSNEFNTRISLMALDMEMESFLTKCRVIYESRGLQGQEFVDISGEEPFESLKRDNWRLLVGSHG